ncbi:MAG: flagellar basal body rod protein FlgC [Planctomycetaceae bacterium]
MSINRMLSTAQISASGLAAERQRMEVIANNIANAHTTRSLSGGPYRRQEMVFTEAFNKALSDGKNDPHALQGVSVKGVEPDSSEFPEVFNPGHPDADENGMVRMPNIKLPNEMVDLITASRAYEANLKALHLFRQMTEQTLSLLRSTT